MRINSNLTSPFPDYSDFWLDYNEYNFTYDYDDLPVLQVYIHTELLYISVFISVICIFGLVGNGKVIWLLGFYIKRNSFTTYILNLAVADVGFLIGILAVAVNIIFHWDTADKTSPYPSFFIILEILFISTYCTSQCLLTMISIERCVSVLFPIWYRCHRPPHLSTILCALIWVLSFLISGINFTLKHLYELANVISLLQLTINSLLCFPLMTVSSLTLFIKVCLKSKQQKRGRLLTAISLTLLIFLILSFPFTALYLITNLLHVKFLFLHYVGFICASLNSSVNPLIYFLVGRSRRVQSRESMKVILQRVFREEEESREQVELQDETQV